MYEVGTAKTNAHTSRNDRRLRHVNAHHTATPADGQTSETAVPGFTNFTVATATTR
jgi:hypothetical protein